MERASTAEEVSTNDKVEVIAALRYILENRVDGGCSHSS